MTVKKKTLIVGGTRGIGSIVARQFIDRGDEVYTASRGKYDEPNHINIDIPDQINIDASLKINYLVFTHRYRGKEWDDDFSITVKGVDRIVSLLKDSFLEEASIVIMGSNAGHYIYEEQPASYHATRAALEALSKYYAVTLGDSGIRCNCVLPATIVKPENRDFFTKDNDVRKMIEAITPLHRMGNASDVSNMVEFLCSEKSSFITGQSFFVDGGVSVRGQEAIARQLSSLRHPNEGDSDAKK